MLSMMSSVIITDNRADAENENSSSLDIWTASGLQEFGQNHSFEVHAFKPNNHFSASSFPLVHKSLSTSGY